MSTQNWLGQTAPRVVRPVSLESCVRAGATGFADSKGPLYRCQLCRCGLAGRREAGPRQERGGPGSPGPMAVVYNCQPQGVPGTGLTRGSGMTYYGSPPTGVLSNNVHFVSIHPPAQASVGRFVLGMNLVKFMDFISNLWTINKFLLVSTARARGCKAFPPTCWVCLRGPCWGNEE